MEFGMGIA